MLNNRREIGELHLVFQNISNPENLTVIGFFLGYNILFHIQFISLKTKKN